jgi:hypothetical protein
LLVSLSIFSPLVKVKSPPAPVKVIPVVPATSKSSFISTAELVSEIAPERERVVTPETAPPVVTSKAAESTEKLPPPEKAKAPED